MDHPDSPSRIQILQSLKPDKQFSLFLALLTTAAFIFRLIAVWQLQDTQAAAAPPPGTDMHTYWELAKGMIDGDLPDHFYYQPFYYSVFLPLVLLAFGTSSLALGIVQAGIGAAAVWLTGWSGRRLFGARAGLLGAACLTLARFHIFYTPFALMAVLQSFWLTLIVAMAIWLCRRPGNEHSFEWSRWGLFGAVVGCANLTRGNIIILVPGIIGLLIWQYWGQKRQLLQNGALFLFLMFAVQMPFSYHNLQQTGRWTGPSTAADAVLALGNNPEAPPGGLFYPPTYESWMGKTRKPGEDRVSVRESIIKWISREPLAWPELKFRAALLFWAPMEIPNNISFAHQGQASSFLQQNFLLDFWIIASLGLAGFGLSLTSPARRRQKTVLFLCFCVLAYWAGTAAFYILARFRLPIVPLLCLFTGYTIHRCWGEIKIWHRYGITPRAKRQLTRFAFILLLPLLFVVRGYELYQNNLESKVIRQARPDGVLASDGKQRILYDHGPEFLGGWQLLELPLAPMEMKVKKKFSPPPVPELIKRTPTRLRVPIIFPTPGRITINVRHEGETVERLQTDRPRTKHGVDWLKIDLQFEDRPHINSPLAAPVITKPKIEDNNSKNRNGQKTEPDKTLIFELIVVSQASQPPYLIIDEQRDYDRTRISFPELKKEPPITGFEAGIQLVFE